MSPKEGGSKGLARDHFGTTNHRKADPSGLLPLVPPLAPPAPLAPPLINIESLRLAVGTIVLAIQITIMFHDPIRSTSKYLLPQACMF